MAAIADLAMGYDVKLLLQYETRPVAMGDWSGGLEYTDPDFVTWESSVAEAGKAGLITVYAGGRTGASWVAPEPHGVGPQPLVEDILGRIEEGVPGSRARFTGRVMGGPVDARPLDERGLRGVRAGPVHPLLGQERLNPTATCTSPGRRPPRTARAT